MVSRARTGVSSRGCTTPAPPIRKRRAPAPCESAASNRFRGRLVAGRAGHPLGGGGVVLRSACRGRGGVCTPRCPRADFHPWLMAQGRGGARRLRAGALLVAHAAPFQRSAVAAG